MDAMAVDNGKNNGWKKEYECGSCIKNFKLSTDIRETQN